jgi:hypothetical protein
MSPGNFPDNGMPFLKKSKSAPVTAITIPAINKNFPRSAIKLISHQAGKPSSWQAGQPLLTIVEKRRTKQYSWQAGKPSSLQAVKPASRQADKPSSRQAGKLVSCFVLLLVVLP